MRLLSARDVISSFWVFKATILGERDLNMTENKTALSLKQNSKNKCDTKHNESQEAFHVLTAPKNDEQNSSKGRRRHRLHTSSTELSITSKTKWCNPRWPVDPMYIPGLFLTGSRPSNTVIACASYSLFRTAVVDICKQWTPHDDGLCRTTKLLVNLLLTKTGAVFLMKLSDTATISRKAWAIDWNIIKQKSKQPAPRYHRLWTPIFNYDYKATKRLMALKSLRSTWNCPDSIHCSTSSSSRAESREQHRRALGGAGKWCERTEKGEEKSEVAVWLAGDAGTGSVLLSFSRFGALRMYIRATNATSTMVWEILLSLQQQSA